MLEQHRRPFGEWAPADVRRGTASWLLHVRPALRDASPVDTLSVRYEDLKADPDSVLQRVVDFVELPGSLESWLSDDATSPAFERSQRVIVRKSEETETDPEAGFAGEGFSAEVVNAPTTNTLSEFERWYVESRCSSEMAELGYPISAFHPDRHNLRRRLEVVVRLQVPRAARVTTELAAQSFRGDRG